MPDGLNLAQKVLMGTESKVSRHTLEVDGLGVKFREAVSLDTLAQEVRELRRMLERMEERQQVAEMWREYERLTRMLG